MRTTVPRYETAGDASQRLLHTIVRFQGRPVHVDDIRQDQTCILSDLITGARFNAHASDEELDISSPPIGYIDTDAFAYFGLRDPQRRYRQGINNDNIRLFSENKDIPPRRLMNLPMQSIGRTILGDFPSREQAEAKLFSKRVEVHSVALNRRIALVKATPKLLLVKHRMATIGMVPAAASAAVLLPEFDTKFFREELETVQLR